MSKINDTKDRIRELLMEELEFLSGNIENRIPNEDDAKIAYAMRDIADALFRLEELAIEEAQS